MCSPNTNPSHRGTPLPTLLLACLLFLTACGGIGAGEPTPTPLPTSSLPGLVTVEPRLCPLAKLPMLRVDEPQGDMLAWSPDTDRLAYLAPATGSTWMVGTLMAVSAPDFSTSQELASYAAGHLTWSPGGEALAYLSLRRSDGLYSVGLAYPQTGQVRDLFPGEAARTDDWSSQKAILGWNSSQILLVQVSCGLDCLQTIQVTLPGATLVNLGDPVKRSWGWWNYRLNTGDELPEQYRALVTEVNWAPDGQRLVYVDERQDAWVILLEEGVQFPLATGGYLSVTETDWSAEGDYLAVQAEDWLFIFGNCP